MTGGAGRSLAGVRRLGLGWASRSAVFDRIVDRVERIGSWPSGTVAVLTYHRVAPVDERPDLFPGLISAVPEEFERQVAYLGRRTRVIGIAELLAARRRSGAIPQRAVLLTFDDAYRDFAEHAWPILRRFGLPATLFVPTAYPDRPDRTFWWDRLWGAIDGTQRTAVEVTHTGRVELGPAGSAARGAAMLTLRDRIKALPNEEALALVDSIVKDLDVAPARSAVLGWDDLRTLAADGVSLAPHSRTHPLLTRIMPDALDDEIAASRDDLERETGSRLPAFAYPSGAHDRSVVEAVRKAGFEIAFATHRAAVDIHRVDWLQVPRMNVGGRSGLPVIRAQLSPLAVRLGRVAGGAS